MHWLFPGASTVPITGKASEVRPVVGISCHSSAYSVKGGVSTLPVVYAPLRTPRASRPYRPAHRIIPAAASGQSDPDGQARLNFPPSMIWPGGYEL